MDRIYRVARNGDTSYVAERDGRVLDLRLRGRTLFDGYDVGEAVTGGLAGCAILAPVRPGKFVCVGLNYRDHAAEMKKALPPEPLLFFKPSTAVLDPGAPILLPPGVGRVDYEAELAVVIGRRAHRVPRARAWDYVFGITASTTSRRATSRTGRSSTRGQELRHVRADRSVHRHGSERYDSRPSKAG